MEQFRKAIEWECIWLEWVNIYETIEVWDFDND